MPPWSCDDIVTCDNFEYMETATFATTGGLVWPAARRLVEYFEAVADDIGLSRPGVQIAELGAGTGWLSVALAKNLPNAERVVATEMRAGGALRWLRRNVRANERAGHGESLRRLTTEECDWSTYLGGEPTRSMYGDGDGDDAPSPATTSTTSPRVEKKTETETETTETDDDVESASVLDSTAWDFVVGSDLVYDDAGVVMLPRVFRRLLDNAAKANARAASAGSLVPRSPGEKKNASSRKPTAYYAHTKYRYELRDIEFFAEMSRCGLVMTEVREPNAPTPPSSPEPLSQLFPEKRIAVFRVERREDVDEEDAA